MNFGLIFATKKVKTNLWIFGKEEIEPKDSGEKLPDDLVLPREFVKGENWSSFKIKFLFTRMMI